MDKDYYFGKYEEIIGRRMKMVVLDVCLDNFYAFKNFHVNLTYPKKIVGSSIESEYLPERSNFRYKKINIVMGANASGKTTFGRMLMKIFNFIEEKNGKILTGEVCDRTRKASFVIDLASKSNVFYRISCEMVPVADEKEDNMSIAVSVRKEPILIKDSYESCLKRMERKDLILNQDYAEELEKIEPLDWMFEYPEDTMRMLHFPKEDVKFLPVLEKVLMALDPSIRKVEASKDVENAYVIRLSDRAVILQNGDRFNTELLSSGTKAGVEVACVLSSLLQNKYSFYYCDEKFPYIHSDIEKAILSLMIQYVEPGEQLFFTTHNAEILNMNLPKHTFLFLRKDADDQEHPITCIDASSLLKRGTDSLKNAVENDLFASAPAVDLIYEIAEI